MARKKQIRTAESELSTKEAILDAALALFAHNGFGGTRMESVAKNIGLSYGSVYYYYPSKDVLFHMTAQRSMEKAVELLQETQYQPGEAYGYLQRFLSSFLNWANTDFGAHSLLLFQQALTGENVPDITHMYVKEKFELIFGRLQTVMEDMPMEGASAKKADHLSYIYNALMIGCAFLHISKMGPSVPDVDTILSFIQ